MAGLSAATVARNLEAIQEELAAAGRAPGEVEILAAVKYLAVEDLDALREGGVTLAGENRAQELERKAQAHPELTGKGVIVRPAARNGASSRISSRASSPFRTVDSLAEYLMPQLAGSEA